VLSQVVTIVKHLSLPLKSQGMYVFFCPPPMLNTEPSSEDLISYMAAKQVHGPFCSYKSFFLLQELV